MALAPPLAATRAVLYHHSKRLRSSHPALALRMLRAVGRIDETDQLVTIPEESPILDSNSTTDLADSIKESADILITVMESRKASPEFRRHCKEAYDKVNALQKLFGDLGQEMMKSLGSDEDKDEELASSKLGQLKSVLDQKAKELGPFLKAMEVLRSLEKKAKPIPKPQSGPVLHKPQPKPKPKPPAAAQPAPKPSTDNAKPPPDKTDKPHGSLG